MERYQKKNFILSVLCVMSVIMLIGGISRERAGTSRQTVQSSLLNTRYVPQVTKIEMNGVEKNHAESEELRKDFSVILTCKATDDGDIWLFSESDGEGPVVADSQKIKTLLSLLSSTDSFTVISDSFKDWKSLGVTESQGTKVVVSGQDSRKTETVFSSLCFGYISAAETHIAVRNESRETVWHIPDRYSPYFTGDRGFWCDLHIFPAILKSSEVSGSISIYHNGLQRVLYSGEERYDQVLKTLKKLTGGTIIAAPAPNSQKIFTVQLQCGIRNSWNFTLFKTEEGQYYAECLSPYDAKRMTVSNWTAQQLLALIS